ncbi:MAG: hypothetical protein ACRD96_05810, partial [Bryobacteraceae bacterium]
MKRLLKPILLASVILSLTMIGGAKAAAVYYESESAASGECGPRTGVPALLEQAGMIQGAVKCSKNIDGSCAFPPGTQ